MVEYSIDKWVHYTDPNFLIIIFDPEHIKKVETRISFNYNYLKKIFFFKENNKF